MPLEDCQHFDAIPDHPVHDAIRAKENLADVLPVDLGHPASCFGCGCCFVRSLPQALDPLSCRTWVVLGDVAADGS